MADEAMFTSIISIVISSGERPIVCKHSHQTVTVVCTLDNTRKKRVNCNNNFNVWRRHWGWASTWL